MQGILADLDAADTPQILVLNKADAVAKLPAEEGARVRDTDWKSLSEQIVPSQMVAVSARDGRGLDKLKAAVEKQLLAMSIKVECVLPYAEAGLLAAVHKVGSIQTEEFVDAGTSLVAFVPASLRNRLEAACKLAGTDFESAKGAAAPVTPVSSKPRTTAK